MRTANNPTTLMCRLFRNSVSLKPPLRSHETCEIENYVWKVCKRHSEFRLLVFMLAPFSHFRTFIVLSFSLRFNVFSFCGAASERGLCPSHSWGFPHNDAAQSIGLLWASKRPVTETRLTTHNTHKRQTSMPPAGFEPRTSAGERPQTYALDRAATGTAPI